MDFYLDDENAYQRLESEFIKYGKLIFGVDFDDTLYDFHGKGRSYNDVIKLLQRWDRYAEIIIFSGNGKEYHYKIERYLKENNVPFKGINIDSSVKTSSRKIYANVWIDDRAGLSVVYNHLMKLIEKIEKGDVRYE